MAVLVTASPVNERRNQLRRRSWTLLRPAERHHQGNCRPCAYRKPYPGVMPDRNRLSWQDDRAVLLRSGRPGIAIQVEGAG